MTITWIKGHYRGEKKSTPHILNETAHILANDFLHKDQGYFNPSKVVIDPPSWEVSILYDQSTITSNLSKTLNSELHSKRNKLPFVKQRNGQIPPSIGWTG